MKQIWNLLLFFPLLNALIGLYKLTGDLGWSIILLTIGLRVIMTPLILPSLKMNQKMQDLAPELAKLKEKHKDNKQALIEAQAQLYRQHGLGPGIGCLPQIFQLLTLIAMFNVFNTILSFQGGDLVNQLNSMLYSFNQLPSDFQLSTRFFYFDLVKPDLVKLPFLPFALPGLLVILSAVTQFLSSIMMTPAVKAEEKLAQKTPQDTDDAMVMAQKQMLYTLPLLTLVFGYQFPAGVVLYWCVLSLVSMVQQYYATGWGGLTPWLKRMGMLK